MADKDEVKTYGVGPAAVKMNTGANVGQQTIIDDKGVARNGSEVVFDPEENLYEVKQEDGFQIDDPNDERHYVSQDATKLHGVYGTKAK